MKVSSTRLPEVLVMEPRVFGDERGHFFESHNQREFEAATGARTTFVQDNQSRSKKNVLRGLHYQNPQAQGKLLRILAGEVFDVVVDIRRSSPTFGQWSSVNLSAENRLAIWVPPGFAHGFLVLSDYAEALYKVTDVYAPQHEHCIAWNDPELAITWPLTGSPDLSAKDQRGKSLKDAELFD
ncbi:MAG: dTDP-4-dehydrorhamnose 3,5-epimerase [Betaproteobacteria bacterium]|nr:dTDP-4-dehydrorhamnose 3,5-epimerase [Betaproteobacteria bacterium]